MTDAIEISLSGYDLSGMLPFLVASAFGLVVLVLDSFHRRGTSQAYLAYFAIVGLVATGLSAFMLWHELPTETWASGETVLVGLQLFSGMAYLDGFGQAFTMIFVTAGILTCLLAKDYLKQHKRDPDALYALILFAVAGMILVATAKNLIVLFLGLETMSLSVYVLAGCLRRSKLSAEAAMKYLILGALASGILLYGIALIYGATGTTDIAEIGRILTYDPQATSLPPVFIESHADHAIPTTSLAPIAFVGMIFILVAFAFKIAAVPFHMWAPDVYTGSPTPIVGFMATAVKAAGFAALLRVFTLAFFDEITRSAFSSGWVQVVFVLCLLTMVVGNVAAVVQNRLKRMLAYSSIAHAGYILIAFTASGYVGDQAPSSAIIFYLVAYTFATIGAFGILTFLERRGEEATTYDDLDGLGFKHPWLGAAMVIFMLSAAGIPPTAGFFAKFLAFKTAIDASASGPAPTMMILLATIGILASVCGVYYYLRVVVHLYMKEATRVIRPIVSWTAGVAVAICAIATLGLGIFPGHLQKLSEVAIERMSDGPNGFRARESFQPVEDDELVEWNERTNIAFE